MYKGQNPLRDQALLAGARLLRLVGEDPPWRGRGDLPMEELHRSPWVLREAGSGTRSEFEEALRGQGRAPEDLPVTLELPSNEAVLSAVMAGAGATALSDLVARGALATGHLHRVPFPLPERPFRLLRHRERGLSHAARTFRDRLLTE
ncbi:LysR substrate-binding domain-containing protein [Azospirillum argentinense]|uniref:LysR substrate-binding domain-containing protein n=1 Tax=Azospirillum argentinense TaxID=2970906 RepID=UPI0027DC9804|nr:LysR substrate-binding domain-containing protein [Azospirillum argentinense]